MKFKACTSSKVFFYMYNSKLEWNYAAVTKNNQVCMFLSNCNANVQWNCAYMIGLCHTVHTRPYITWQENVGGSTVLNMFCTIIPETVLLTKCWPFFNRTFSILWIRFCNWYKFNKCFIFFKGPSMKFHWRLCRS